MHCDTCATHSVPLTCGTCATGYYPTNSAQQCTSCGQTLNDCIECSGDDSKVDCIKCNTRILHKGLCLTCPLIIPNCTNCDTTVPNTTKCTQCQSGFFLSGDQLTCPPCNVAVTNCINCTGAAGNVTCTDCDPRYVLYN